MQRIIYELKTRSSYEKLSFLNCELYSTYWECYAINAYLFRFFFCNKNFSFQSLFIDFSTSGTESGQAVFLEYLISQLIYNASLYFTLATYIWMVAYFETKRNSKKLQKKGFIKKHSWILTIHKDRILRISHYLNKRFWPSESAFKI